MVIFEKEERKDEEKKEEKGLYIKKCEYFSSGFETYVVDAIGVYLDTLTHIITLLTLLCSLNRSQKGD